MVFPQAFWYGLIIISGGNTEQAQVGSSIVMAESHGDTKVVSPTQDYGPWQIHLAAHPDVTRACAEDPACSTKKAEAISSGWTNFSAWTTYKTGAYKKYTTAAAHIDQKDAAKQVSDYESKHDGFLTKAGKLILGGTPGGVIAGVGPVGDAIQNGDVNPLKGIDKIAEILGDLVSAELWQRIGLIVLGGGTIAVALVLIGRIGTGQGSSATKAASKTVKHVKTIAKVVPK